MGVPSRFGQIQADAFLGAAHDNSPFGKIWYVDNTEGADGNSGEAPDEALATIGQAITNALAGRGDTVVIRSGTYTVTSALTPKSFMTFRAAVVMPHAPSVSIRGNITNLTTVDVNGVRFIGIEFRATGTSVEALVALSQTTAISEGVLFEDCTFNGADQGPRGREVSGINVKDASNATTGLVVRRCLFKQLGFTAIDVGVNGIPFAKIEDNTFRMATENCIGIALADTTNWDTGDGFNIRYNDFIITPTGIGIQILSTGEDHTAVGVIRNNFFAYSAAAAITANSIPRSFVNNYVGDSGTGGSLVDAGD